MSVPYTMTRDNRRRKRDLYLRAHRMLFNLNEAVREMKDLAADLALDYESAGHTKSAIKARRAADALTQVEDTSIRLFLDLPEEIG